MGLENQQVLKLRSTSIVSSFEQMINHTALLTDLLNVHVSNYCFSTQPNIENMYIHNNEFYSRAVSVSRQTLPCKEISFIAYVLQNTMHL